MKACSAAITAALIRALDLARSDAGQSLVEYGLLLVLLAMVAIAALSLAGGDVQALFTAAESEFRNASTP